MIHVDEEDNIIEKVTRNDVNEKNLRMRGSIVIIFNKQNQFLVQKRASKKLKFPDNWELGVSETVFYGESYEAAAIRGLKEELNITGISNLDIAFLFKLKHTSSQAKRWYKIFSLTYNGKIELDKNEVSKSRFVSEDKLNNMFKKEKFAPVALETYEKLKKQIRGVSAIERSEIAQTQHG